MDLVVASGGGGGGSTYYGVLSRAIINCFQRGAGFVKMCDVILGLRC